MNAAAQYRQLLQLGRDEFIASAAPAALVRYRSQNEDAEPGMDTETIDQDEIEETLPLGKVLSDQLDLEVYPLAKKPGASFPDRITIGRTGNNDVVLADTSVSRLHAYIRRGNGGWVVADAGSKNGSWISGAALEARREHPLPSRAMLRFGDVDVTFYTAADLYGALGGS